MRDKDQFKLYINDEEIVKVPSTCFLGVMIDDKLTWREQVGLVYNKITKNKKFGTQYMFGKFI